MRVVKLAFSVDHLITWLAFVGVLRLVRVAVVVDMSGRCYDLHPTRETWYSTREQVCSSHGSVSVFCVGIGFRFFGRFL